MVPDTLLYRDLSFASTLGGHSVVICSPGGERHSVVIHCFGILKFVEVKVLKGFGNEVRRVACISAVDGAG